RQDASHEVNRLMPRSARRMVHGDMAVHGIDVDPDVGPLFGAVDQNDASRGAGIELQLLEALVEQLQLLGLHEALGQEIVVLEAELVHHEDLIEIGAAVELEMSVKEIEVLGFS